MHFLYSVYYELTAATCFERYLLIFFREERRLRVFENRVLRRIFGHKTDVVTGKPNGLYSSPTILRVIKSRRMRWAGHVARMEEERGVYRVFGGKT
jgi:hypothetical protein